jgi:site-specific recombinase XerD
MKIIHPHPRVLTLEEVAGFIDSIAYLKHKAMLSTMYSSGLRVSEVCHLHYDDISRKNRQIYVRTSKNRLDRYTILSERNLDILTEYWMKCGRPRGILFPSRTTGSYLVRETVNQAFKQNLERYGIRRDLTCHSLRHSFAVHLLEAGVDKTHIQQLLGHTNPNSTEVYLQLTNKVLMGIRSPFDTYGGWHS